jgi:predicted phosphodiesterase
MKIAVLSDIHGNVPALDAVLDDIEGWGPNEVIVNGDLVNRGPYSLACVRMLRRRFPGCRYLKGNHESYVLRCASQTLDPDDPKWELERFARWTCDQLGVLVDDIAGWGDHLDLDDLEGGSFHITHGSRLGDRDGITPETPDEVLEDKLGDARDLFVSSHTHRPLQRYFNGTLVVNTGSVGQPFDGDPRASYGRFTFSAGRWQSEITRVPFDKARAEADFADSGFLEEGGPLARVILTELRQSRMHMGHLMRRYLAAMRAGEVSVADAVEAYLAEV